MKYRNEWKQEINLTDIYVLRQRLRAVANTDAHASDGVYVIRSLYFDNLYDKALLEKINGVDRREKFRLRIYNADTTTVFLEKKSKVNGMCAKERSLITKEQAEKILHGDYDFSGVCEDSLLNELCYKIRTQGLHPKTIVEYTREPFTFPAGNVRVTLDYNIRTGLNCVDFLNPNCITVPAGEVGAVLEVKWDEFLPSIIRDAVQIKGRRTTSFSKYAACRIYG